MYPICMGEVSINNLIQVSVCYTLCRGSSPFKPSCCCTILPSAAAHIVRFPYFDHRVIALCLNLRVKASVCNSTCISHAMFTKLFQNVGSFLWSCCPLFKFTDLSFFAQLLQNFNHQVAKCIFSYAWYRSLSKRSRSRSNIINLVS